MIDIDIVNVNTYMVGYIQYILLSILLYMTHYRGSHVRLVFLHVIYVYSQVSIDVLTYCTYDHISLSVVICYLP